MRVEVTRFADAIVIKPFQLIVGDQAGRPERSFALSPDEFRVLLRGLSEECTSRILNLPIGEPAFFEVPDPAS